MRRLLLLLSLLFSSFHVFSQNTFLSSGSLANKLVKRYTTISGILSADSTAGLRPTSRSAIPNLITRVIPESAKLSAADQYNLKYLKAEGDFLDSNKTRSTHNLPLGIYKFPANFIEVNTNDFQLTVNPAFNLQIGHSSLDTSFLYTNIRAIEIKGSINDRLGFYTFISENQLRPAEHERVYKEKFNAFPGAHLVKDYKGNAYDYLLSSGYITFKVLPAISMQFGQSRNFIGYGQRSLLLSDFATDYLFFKINTKVWRLNYQNIFAKLIDNNNTTLRPLLSKYMTAHYLGIDILNNWNLGFYESVIFHDSEETGRGFDFYYLNPIIFYRSVEHALGDADKVMVGLNTAWLPLKSVKLYGQLMLNEFRINDLKARNGHAGNKFGYQLGIDWINMLGISNMDINIEYNRVRPYSYSHKAIGKDTHSVNSYSHYGQPLAHPLGANFNEIIATIHYQPLPKILIELNMISAKYGADSLNSNWGNNIFLDYTTAEQEYNNKVGQGISTDLLIAELITTWHIKHNLFLDIELKYRKLESALTERNSENYYIGAALRLNLWRRKWVY